MAAECQSSKTSLWPSNLISFNHHRDGIGAVQHLSKVEDRTGTETTWFTGWQELRIYLLFQDAQASQSQSVSIRGRAHWWSGLLTGACCRVSCFQGWRWGRLTVIRRWAVGTVYWPNYVRTALEISVANRNGQRQIHSGLSNARWNNDRHDVALRSYQCMLKAPEGLGVLISQLFSLENLFLRI